MIYDYFRVTGVNDSVLDYADLFSVVLRNDNIQEFDTRWDKILLSMEQFPPDDILESLYKVRLRESEKLKTVVHLYNLEIHQKRAKPHYHSLKIMVTRYIEQDLRSRNSDARDERIESNIFGITNNVVFTKDKENVGNGKPAGSVRKETHVGSGTMK